MADFNQLFTSAIAWYAPREQWDLETHSDTEDLRLALKGANNARHQLSMKAWAPTVNYASQKNHKSTSKCAFISPHAGQRVLKDTESCSSHDLSLKPEPGYNSVIFKIKQSNTNYLQQLMWYSHCWWYVATLGAIMLISRCQQLLQWLLCNQLRLSHVQYRHFPHSTSFQRSHDKCWHEAACLTKNNHKAFWATVKAVQIKFRRSEKRQLLLGVLWLWGNWPFPFS